DPGELPRVRRPVVPLVGSRLTGVVELVAHRLPGRTAVVGTLDHLPEPAARLGREQPVRSGGPSPYRIELPAPRKPPRHPPPPAGNSPPVPPPPPAPPARPQHNRPFAAPANHPPRPHHPPPGAPRRPPPPPLSGGPRRGPGGRPHHGPAPGPGLSRPIPALRR